MTQKNCKARILKRSFDIAAASASILIFAPLLGLLALVIYVSLGTPVLFRQKRPGLRGDLFTIYKFRTMIDARDSTGKMLPDDRRLTSFGRFLRRTSMDELPQLFNVLRGDLSFVGPRPLLVEYLPFYTPAQARRHDVRPGMTGWAQVNGRNAVTWEEKFAMDVWYVDNMSFLLDIRILCLTLVKVLRREGIGSGGDDLVERFRGPAQG